MHLPLSQCSQWVALGALGGGTCLAACPSSYQCCLSFPPGIHPTASRAPWGSLLPAPLEWPPLTGSSLPNLLPIIIPCSHIAPGEEPPHPRAASLKPCSAVSLRSHLNPATPQPERRVLGIYSLARMLGSKHAWRRGGGCFGLLFFPNPPLLKARPALLELGVSTHWQIPCAGLGMGPHIPSTPSPPLTVPRHG